ncbi:MAG: hypothetical protein K2X46_05455, partial [Roseomonas sp.]|nr:hypothetical protein [Roseomonas sp.]
MTQPDMRRAMRNIVPAILFSLVLAAPAGAQAPAPPQSEPVRIINRTGQEATALHAVRSGRPDWGSNLLNRGPLPANAAFALRVNPNVHSPTPHEYTATGHAATKFGVPLLEARALYRWAMGREHLWP